MDDLTDTRPVDVAAVELGNGFLGARAATNRERTIPTQYDHLRDTHRLEALDPDYRPGEPDARHKFWDSDVAKWLEAASYALACGSDPVLATQVAGTVDRLGRMQQEDGYLNSWFTMVYPERRWTNLRDDHELYCAGHLMEAAAAHKQATGEDAFIDIMTRYADYIASTFGPGPGQRRGYPGHEEIELALVKLAAASGNRRYLDLSRYFIDERGRGDPHYYDVEAEARGDTRRGGYDYCQAHMPVREQTRAVGHAVRAMYLYSGMADMARLDQDAELDAAVLRLWDNVVQRQMYVTGSVGASSQGERFTLDYDLPEETSYCETCAAIGLVFWAQRLANQYGDGRFVDVLERALYNGVLCGVSLSGDRYFYVNPLASTGSHHRSEWFGCACCPPNLARLLASLGQYMYSEGDAAWVHLYEAGRATLRVAGERVVLTQSTRYPWAGQIEISVEPEREARFPLHLRLPGWCSRATLGLNGEDLPLDEVTARGYARLDRTWRAGDRLLLELDMPVQRVRAHPAVRMANGKVALQRGPVVYCLEEADNDIAPLSRLALPLDAEVRAEHRPDLLGGIVALQAQALVQDTAGWGDDLYRTGSAATAWRTVTAVPYCVWDNREPGAMQVWLREA